MDIQNVTKALGAELRRELLVVTLEEFRLTELRYVSDLRLGQELLYLLSNADWTRRSTELLDVSRVAAVETKLTVDIDTSHIVHEAMKAIDGPLWLPLFTLPSSVPDADADEPDAGSPDLPIGMDVFDAQGCRVAGVPQAEVRRHLAAALAEALVARLDRLPGSTGEHYDRAHQVVLAAALARLLTQPPTPDPPAGTQATVDPPAGKRAARKRAAGKRAIEKQPVAEQADGAAAGGVPDDPADHGTRLGRARVDLLSWLDGELAWLDREQAPAAAARPDPESVLASREAEIVHALRACTLVVVPVERGGPCATSFTLVMPTRPLTPSSRRAHARAVELRIALLAPTTHADRVVEVVLPEGVQVRSGGRGRPEAVVEVAPLPQIEQLCRLVEWIVLDARRPIPGGWPRKQLAELAGTKLDAVVQCLLHHYEAFAGDPATGPLRENTADMIDGLRELRVPLARLGSLRVPRVGVWHDAAVADDQVRRIAELWSALCPRLAAMTLRRRLNRSTTAPGSVRFRASAIDEFTQRARPVRAYVRLQVESGQSPVLGTARAVNAVNVLVLAVVAAFLLLDPLDAEQNGSRAEVLAAVLTIFPTIQASRLRQPDATGLDGVLTMRHFSAGIATALPGLLLAGVLAFEPDGAWPKTAAVLAVLLQVGCALWIRRLRRFPYPDRWTKVATWLGRRLRAARLDRVPGAGLLRRAVQRLRRPLVLRTVRSPDHERLDTLRTAWCRSLTGDVLLIGRAAHPYVVVDSAGNGSLAELLTDSQGTSGDPTVRPDHPVDAAGDGWVGALWRFMTTGPGEGDAAPVAPPPRPDHLVNIIGALRGTAVDRSVTFLMFREPPRKQWESGGTDGQAPRRQVTPLDLERVQPAPMEPPDWVIDVMLGFPRDSTWPVCQHPLAQVESAAQQANFTTINVQFPAPPLQGKTARQWLRVRIGVPFRTGDSLQGLVRFLRALQGLRNSGTRVHLREVPQMESLDATQTAPEDSFDAPPGLRLGRDDVPRRAGPVVTDADLEVTGPEGSSWRLVAVCAPPRAGLVADALKALADRGGVRTLTGAISGVLNGTVIMFLLCSADDATGADHEALSRRLTEHPAMLQHSAQVTVLPGVPSPAQAQCEAAARALLRVQIRTPDRPGVLQDLLRELAAEIKRAAGQSADESEPTVDVLYTLTPVVDGQAISGRMMVRLPEQEGGPEAWTAVAWFDVGRRVERAVGRRNGAGSIEAERTSRRSDDTVVTLELVRRQFVAEPDGHQQPADAGEDQPAAAEAG